jgi:hypothetical protein
MPLKIRWTKKEYFSLALMLLGACGLFQALIIFISQYFLSLGNHLVLILIPIFVTLALFYASTIIFESFAQVERRQKIKRQFQKSVFRREKLIRFMNFPITKPMLIIIAIFIPLFLSSYFISILYVNNIISFLIAENMSTIVCFLVANLIEKRHGRVQKY